MRTLTLTLILLLSFFIIPSDAKSKRHKTDSMWKNRKRDCERELDLCGVMHIDTVSEGWS